MSEGEPHTKRVFFAIRLSNTVATSLTESLTPLKKDLRGRWTHPEDLHITLKFLGNIDPSYIDGLLERSMTWMTTQQAFELSLGHLNFFPRRHGSHVLWLGIQNGSSHLHQLSATLDTLTHELGFALETRPYTAHITLARIRMQAIALEKYLQQFLGSIPAISMRATHLELMETRSPSTPDGARYACLQSMAFHSISPS